MRLRIRGVPVIIDYYFIAVLTLMLVVFKNENILMCFVFCILHELGHLTAMTFFGERAKSVTLGYFGMRIDCGARILPKIPEIVIAAAGPTVNLILMLFCRLFKLDEAAQINLSLAVFNLLPVTMLDGGKILSSFVTERTIRIIGITIGIILSFLGAAVAVYTRRNFLILVVSLYVLIGAIK
ncbi:MAG: hypothetical protein EGR81_02380 [Ruminococcaceae bacterium]|nr:hypothetical protein [Oscillospiraceae bacterium]